MPVADEAKLGLNVCIRRPVRHVLAHANLKATAAADDGRHAQEHAGMTGAIYPTDVRPVVALFCTRGMEAFLSNAIEGLLRVGIDADQVCIGCPENALKSVKRVARLHSRQIRVIRTQKLSETELETEQYASFGSRSFTDISWKKIFFIRQLIYADLDVSWIRNPLPYLTQVAEIYPLAFQTEELPRFPPVLCLGFASFVRSERAIALLDALIALHSDQIDNDNRLDDQAACQYLIENDVTWLRYIYWLPEALFLNGLGYRNLQGGEHPSPMEGELQPFLFHANWTVGTDNKRALLTSTGNWSPGSSLTDTALQDQEPSAALPVLTVIYPVFDVRGDIVERVRLWTEGQDFDPLGYRVFVVAGSGTELDEAALRKILRNQDAILRVPGRERDANYWNAGAREAKTPWLLFVEAHGLPERDSLSQLAAWIAANPDGQACNFRIRNLEGHHLAGLCSAGSPKCTMSGPAARRGAASIARHSPFAVISSKTSVLLSRNTGSSRRRSLPPAWTARASSSRRCRYQTSFMTIRRRYRIIITTRQITYVEKWKHGTSAIQDFLRAISDLHHPRAPR